MGLGLSLPEVRILLYFSYVMWFRCRYGHRPRPVNENYVIPIYCYSVMLAFYGRFLLVGETSKWRVARRTTLGL